MLVRMNRDGTNDATSSSVSENDVHWPVIKSARSTP